MSAIGGQAVLEGVMMRGPSHWTVAVRKPDGEIAEVSQTVRSVMVRHRIWRLPVIRGVVALGESLAIGCKALAISANYAAAEEAEVVEKLAELDVPAMVHVSASCNPAFHGTGAHYINGDTTAFMQFLTADLFKDFPTLKFIIPHGGGAVPYHWGRYRGLAQDMKRPPLKELLLNNVFFDTCVYHQPGIDLLFKVVPLDNILFGSEMVGAVRGIDPTRYCLDSLSSRSVGPSFASVTSSASIEAIARSTFSALTPALIVSGPRMTLASAALKT